MAGWTTSPMSASVVDLLAVVPSVVFGLWGVLVLAEPISDFYQKVSDALSPIPVIGCCAMVTFTLASLPFKLFCFASCCVSNFV